MRVETGQASIIGSRNEQQDRILCLERNRDVLAAVCDGMGGMSNGALASTTAVEQLKQLFLEKENGTSPKEFYYRAVDILDERVYALRRRFTDAVVLGTTIVTATVGRGQLNWLSVGDSRLYMIRGKEIICVTTDHNYLMDLQTALENGEITHGQYQRELPKGATLTSYIGMGGIEKMDRNAHPLPLRPGDVMLLMSDGLYRHVSEQEMLELSSMGASAQELADQLIARSEQNAQGIQDNASVVVLCVMED